MSRYNQEGLLVSDDEEEEIMPSPKRARVEAARDFPRGTVKLMRMNNFMTYGDTVVVPPGPRLNLVLGPNGTGKSSLVCALCVGLGGSTKLLGRADSIKDYIKRGQSEAWTEITLSGGPGRRDWVVRRHMQRTESGYSSTWKINNQMKTQKDVAELVASLNIQFDNLCQFLPQDKVVEFARMDPHELLVATEKAIGDASLHDKHEELIKLCKDAKEGTLSRDALERELKRLEESNAKLERDYKRFRQREELEQKKALLESKLLWANVNEKQQEVVQAEGFLKKAKDLLHAYKEQADNESGPLRRLKAQLGPAEAQQKAAVEAARRLQNKRLKLNTDAEAGEAGMQDASRELADLQERSDQRAARIAKAEADLAAVTHGLSLLPPPVDNSAEVRQISHEVEQILQQERILSEQKQDLERQLSGYQQQESQMQLRLRHLNSAKHQIMAKLAQTPQNQGVREADEWVKQQKRQGGFFKGEVYGPVAAEIQLRDARHANIVEMAISSSLGCFVVQYREDEQKLTQHFRRMQFRGSVLCYKNAIDAPLSRPNGMASQYAQYGIRHSMDEMIEAPKLVLHALNDVNWLSSNFIMEGHDTEAYDRLFKETAVRTVYTSEQKVQNLPSKYTSITTLQTVPLKASSVLHAGGNAGQADQEVSSLTQQLQEIKRLSGQCEAALRAKGAERDAIKAQQDALNDRKLALGHEAKEARRQRGLLMTKQKAVQSQLDAAKRVPDPLLERPQREAAVKAAAAKHVQLLLDLSATVREEWGALKALAVAELTHRELDMQIKALSDASEARKKALQDKRTRVTQTETVVKQTRERLQHAKSIANAQCPLTEELKAKFAEPDMPDTREDIRKKIEEVAEALDDIQCNNPGVAEEYKRVQAEITRLRSDIEEMTADVDSTNARINTIKSAWLPELKRIVEAINTSFSKNFAECCCAGEVLLVEHEDYAKYSISIMVKFREGEELQQLTANRQSGGERSVSTILYLIALQGVTVTPFRVVDEINQGMDPVNERKVFTQLVQASCREGTPQCFLLTPKLLPDLPFGPNITVLNIFNGAQIGADVARSFGLATMYGRKYEQLMSQQQQQQAQLAC